MKLLTFSKDNSSYTRLGAYLGESLVVDMALAYREFTGGHAPDWFCSVASLLQGGDKALELAQEVIKHVDVDQGEIRQLSYIFDVDEIKFHSPASPTAKILCVTMNYHSHAASSLTKPAEEPYFFIKMPSLMTPHRSHILLSKTSLKCDSEIEMCVVIGKRGKYISQDDAFDYVAGYTVGNDFSFRDRRTLQSDPNSARIHWFTLKNLDTAVPIGPWLVTMDEIPDPYDLEISLTLENAPEERQSGSTKDMMHKIPSLIEHASNGLTLEPGDVIFTGTPHQLAFGHERYLEEGDILRAEIEGIGALINPVRRET